VREQLKARMMAASDALEFESAAAIRNRLSALSHVTADQTINPEGVEEADVFGAYQDGGQTCVQVFFFRTGQNWGNRAYVPRADRSLDIGEVLDSFIAQFYDDKPVPRLILLSHDVPNRALLAEALSLKAERKVEIRVPQRGTKTGVVEHALNNAKEALGRRLAEGASQRRLLEALADRFGLAEVPRRIEVFDNSHVSGTNAVGGMIVAGADGMVKGQYRKFNIKSDNLTPGDDYAMMREVLTRRFKRIAGTPAPAEDVSPVDLDTIPETPADVAPPEDIDEVEETAFPEKPDLVLIDGGLGQLNIAREVFDGLGIGDVALIGVAKGPDRDAGREHFHIPGRERPIMLEARDPVLYFVQRLRDEAHRFAIGAHRARRTKAIGANPLDEIEGIGPTRKRALLHHFGSAKAVSRASVSDLTAVSGISQDTAQRIYDHFNERDR
jgi:excinuclease ABC subunit C